MEGQGTTQFQLVPTNYYSENFKRPVVKKFERGSLNKKELENERYKVITYKKLIEIAEREDGVSISKKDVARQLEILREDTLEK